MTEERPPTRRQQQAAATQEQLLAAARDVFEAKGYRATTIGAVTAQASTAHGTFYLYFKNKEDVFAQVMARATEELYREAEAGTDGDPRETLAAGIRGFLVVFVGHRRLWRALLEGALQHAEIQRMWLDLRRRFIDRIAATMDEQQSAGLIRPFDSEVAAHALGSMVEWLAFTNFVLDEPGADHTSVERAVEVLTDLWFHAVYGRA